MKRVVTALALMVALAACASNSRKSESPSREAAPGGPFDWDAPKPEGLYLDVADLSSISSSLPFTPIEPQLKGLLHIDMTDPNKIQREGMLLLFFFQDPDYGRIVVTEQLTSIDQEALESILQYNTEPTSEAVFSLVKLDDGTQALVSIRKIPSEDGLAPNGVEFLVGDADITIYGPDGSFTLAQAIPVANLVLPNG